MSQTNNSNHTSENEVNLTPLFLFIKRKFDQIGNRIVYSFKIVEKYFFLIATITAIFIGLSVVNYFTATPTYHSTAIFTSNLLSNHYSESFINELRWLAKEKDYNELSRLLQMNLEDVKKIKKVEYEGFTASSKDTIIGTPFKINVLIKDNSILDTLQYKIHNYLENNPYAIKRRQAKKATLIDFAAVVHKEIIELDSIKRVVSLKSGFTSSSLASYSKILTMCNERLRAMEQLALLKNYDVLQEFTAYRKPYSPRLLRDAVEYGFIGGVFGFFLALYKERKRNKEEEKIYAEQEKEKEPIA